MAEVEDDVDVVDVESLCLVFQAMSVHGRFGAGAGAGPDDAGRSGPWFAVQSHVRDVF